MLAAAEDAVQVAGVVARPIVASAPGLDEEALVLAVLLALVVLLPVLHQPALPFERGLRSGTLDVGLHRQLRRRGVQLLHDVPLGLGTVVSHRVGRVSDATLTHGTPAGCVSTVIRSSSGSPALRATAAKLSPDSPHAISD